METSKLGFGFFCLFHPTILQLKALISALVTTLHLQKHPQDTSGKEKKRNNLSPILNHKVIFPQQRANRILHNAQNECLQKNQYFQLDVQIKR